MSSRAQKERTIAILSMVFAVVFVSAATARASMQAASQQASPQSHAKLELIAEEDSFRPGHTLWVGLHFELDDGWHIYWRNPGDSGEPPRIEWNLPAGFEAGAIRWPAPKRLGSGSVVDYGYEGQVLLMAPLRITASVKAASPVTIGASVRYLVCREICIPGKAVVTLAIPPAAKDFSRAHFSQWRELFAQTRGDWPRPIPGGWKIAAETKGDQFILSVHGAAAPRDAAFFPLDANVIENSGPQVLARSGAGFRLTLRKSDQLINPVAVLRGVLVVEGTRAYEISAPVAPR
jgi:DsbC/DsbD-like thiol-disulfide interchange protein